MTDPKIGTARGTGQILDSNAAVLCIEFHARAGNSGSVYVAMSDVSNNNGREIPPGESWTFNCSLPDVGASRGSVLMSKFYAQMTGGDSLDYAAIVR